MKRILVAACATAVISLSGTAIAMADGGVPSPALPVTVNGTQVCIDTGDNSVATGPASVTVGNETVSTSPGSVSPGRLAGCVDPTHPPSPPSVP